MGKCIICMSMHKADTSQETCTKQELLPIDWYLPDDSKCSSPSWYSKVPHHDKEMTSENQQTKTKNICHIHSLQPA